MQKGLVSVLTPAYNTAAYIPRLLDSVLSQTYPYIEMIVMDDGSTDNLPSVVKSYIQPFQDKGYTLEYFRQENAGQSVAIKNGLQKVRGEFLVWPDSDDYYASNKAIALMVHELENAPSEFQIVRTQQRIVKEKTGELIRIKGLDAKVEEPADLFEDCLISKKGFMYTPGSGIVRTQILYEVTHFDIYTSKDAGQNWQLMLPILYKYRCKTIMQPLYNIVARASSHSRGQFRGYEATVRKYRAYLSTQIETLKRIDGFPSELINQYRQQLTLNYNKRLFSVAIRCNNRKAAQERLGLCMAVEGRSIKSIIFETLLKLKGGTYFVYASQHFVRKIKKIKKDDTHL